MNIVVPGIILPFFLYSSAFAQLVNYQPNGKSVTADSERISIVIYRPDSTSFRAASANIALPGVVGSLVSLGLNLVKTALTNQEEKYTASYSAALSERALLRLQNANNPNTAQLNIDSIGIYRLVALTGGKKDTALAIILQPEVEHFSGVFRLKVVAVQTRFAKAKIRRIGTGGKSIDLNLSVKLDALWQEPATGVPASGTNGKSDSAPTPRSGYTIKTATLGDASLVIAGIRPGRFYELRTAGYATNWFQLPPQMAMASANQDNHYTAGYYNLTVTIKEVNPCGVNSKKIADFFSSGSSDILTAVKSILPQTGK